jgi:hypothetical protein
LNPKTTNPNNCVIVSNLIISGLYQLKSVMLPITNYNINSTNNSIYFNESNSSLKTCIIPEGFYSSFSDVATALQTSMNSSGTGTYTCTVSSLTNKLTISSTVDFKLLFGSNTVNSASTVLGFVGDSSSSLTSQTGDHIMNISINTNYNFVIENTSSSITTLDGKTFSFSIPALSSTPNMVYWQVPLEMPIFIRFDGTRNINVKIVDDDMKIIQNLNSDWYIVLDKKS